MRQFFLYQIISLEVYLFAWSTLGIVKLKITQIESILKMILKRSTDPKSVLLTLIMQFCLFQLKYKQISS